MMRAVAPSPRTLAAAAAATLVLALPDPGGSVPGAGSGPASAQQPAAADDTAAAQDTGGVTFDFQNADLRAVLTALAEASGMNIVYSDLPDRRVTLRTATPVAPGKIRALLQSVVDANGLAMEEKAGIVRIYAPEETGAGAARGDTARPGAAAAAPPPGGPPRLFVHRLAHADAATVAQTLRTLFGLGGGRGGPAGARAGGGVASLSERLQQQQTAGYRSFSEPGGQGRQRRQPPAGRRQRRAAPPPSGEGQQQEEGEDEGPGTGVLLQGPVEIVPDTRTNSILVLANPADFETVKAAIEKLDRRPLQVLIEVLIVEVRRSDNLSLSTSAEVPADGAAPGDDGGGDGGDGGGDGGDGGAAGGDGGGDAPADVGGSLDAMGNLALEVLGLGSVDASAVLNLLSQSTDATILSRPVVMAQNNEEARILVGDQRPFVQLTRATEGGAVDQVVQYQNVGTELRIRPTINRDGFVNLEVLQEVSNATQVTQFNAPVINTRESETDVLVRDGHTVVLGGLVDRQTEITRSGIPLLKDIPVLGGLFGSTSRREVASELFILLTPHVLHTDADLEEAREEIERSSEMLREEMPDPIPLIRMDSVRADSAPALDTVPAAPDSVAPTRSDSVAPSAADTVP